MENEAGANIYRKVENSRCPRNGFACGIPLVPFAYLICAYMIVEGLVILIEDPNLGVKGPFEDSESGFLQFIAWGDIVFAVLGAVGIWFSHNLLPIGWRHTSKMHGTIAMLGAGALLLWRVLVCLSFAPWAGIMLAFSTQSSNTRTWVFILICVYLALSIFFVYVLTLAFRQVISDGKSFQHHLDTQHKAERKMLLNAAHNSRSNGEVHDGEMMHDHEIEPELFYHFPLAETVTLYTVLMAVVCLWNFLYLCITSHTSGGWAFFASKPEVSSTWWLEFFLWSLSFLCALIGICGASTFLNDGWGWLDDTRSVKSLLIFLLASMLRFSLLFAVTGMDLVQKDVCGFYINGLAKVAYSSYWSPANGFIHCRGIEYLFLAGTLLCCLLDGYMIYGTFQLWHHAQGWKVVRKSWNADAGGYSAVEEDGGYSN